MKNSNSVEHFKIELDEFRNNGKKKKLIEHFRKLSDDIFNRILPAHWPSGFANGPGDRSSISGRVIPKTQKMVLDTSLLNTQL